MTIRLVSTTLWTRWGVVLWALAVLYWLGLEDNFTWPVALLGITGTLLGGITWLAGRHGGRHVALWRGMLTYALFGLMVGAGGSVVTVLLMMFKNVWHAHLVPDYPNALLGATLARGPMWALGGLLCGLGLSLLLIREDKSTLTTTRLYMIRHGETDWNVERRFQGQTDTELNANGQAQAQAVAERLAALDAPFTALYASPLKRTMQTAETIAHRLGLTIQPAPEIKEIHCGEWEGLVSAEIERKYPGQLEQWRANVAHHRLPGGECVDDVQARGIIFLERVLQAHPGESIIIVGHGASLLALIAYLQQWEVGPTWNDRSKRLDNTGLTVIHANANRPGTVERYNWLGDDA
jgi:broad specificity phosphatase PhoE